MSPCNCELSVVVVVIIIIAIIYRRLSLAPYLGLFTPSIPVTMFVKVIIKVWHCVDGDGHFRGQNRLHTILSIKVSVNKIIGAAHSQKW